MPAGVPHYFCSSLFFCLNARLSAAAAAVVVVVVTAAAVVVVAAAAVVDAAAAVLEGFSWLSC